MKILSLILLTISLNSFAANLDNTINSENSDLIKRALIENLSSKRVSCINHQSGVTTEYPGADVRSLIEFKGAVATVAQDNSQPIINIFFENDTLIKVSEVITSADLKDVLSIDYKKFKKEVKEINVGTLINPSYEVTSTEKLAWSITCDVIVE